MEYMPLAYFHLGTVFPAFLIASFLFLNRKGTSLHKMLGRVFMLLVLITAVTTLFMTAQVGPTLFNHFGFIHLFSVLALWSVPQAYFAIRRGDVNSHRGALVGLYIGGMVIAGGFAFMPGRLLHSWFFA